MSNPDTSEYWEDVRRPREAMPYPTTAKGQRKRDRRKRSEGRAAAFAEFRALLDREDVMRMALGALVDDGFVLRGTRDYRCALRERLGEMEQR